MTGIKELLTQLKTGKPQRAAVAAAASATVLKSVAEAYREDIIQPILCGEKKEILEIASRERIDLVNFEIVDVSEKECAKTAVSLVRSGQADMLIKGNLHTSALLREVLKKESGLRGNGILSHVGILKSGDFRKTFLITDAGLNMYPDLEMKVHLIENAVKAAKGIGICHPKVAALAAVEVVNPKMQATLDAALLTVMNQRGQILGCEVDGPLAMDLAVSQEAAHLKKIHSPVAGQADILLMHDIEMANATLKALTFAGGYLLGGVIMGASVPIAMTSRADQAESRLYSIACAAAICKRKGE